VPPKLIDTSLPSRTPKQVARVAEQATICLEDTDDDDDDDDDGPPPPPVRQTSLSELLDKPEVPAAAPPAKRVLKVVCAGHKQFAVAVLGSSMIAHVISSACARVGADPSRCSVHVFRTPAAGTMAKVAELSVATCHGLTIDHKGVLNGDTLLIQVAA